ncbi:MAG: transcription elongation factor Spt5 [Acidilobus sp.]
MSEQGSQPSASQSRPSRFYALRVVGGNEEKVALLLGERAKALSLDVRSVVYSKDLKGVVFVEVGDVKDLYYLIRGVKGVKGRALQVNVNDVIKFVRPTIVSASIEKGQLIQVIGGPFKGMKGKVIEVRKSEVDITLLEGDSKIVVTVPIDQVRPVSESEERPQA